MARRKLMEATAMAVLQAPEVNDGSDSGESDSKRKQVSKRSFLKDDGTEAERIEEATGARYTLLAPGGNLDFDMQFGDAGKFTTMCAIFGFHTKIGNVANTVLNDKQDPGTPQEAGDAIREFIKSAEAGTWAERTGGVGAKVDKDALAGAIVDAYKDAGKDVDYQKARDLLEDPAMVRKFRQNPEIAAKYAERVGRAVSLDDLAAKLA